MIIDKYFTNKSLEIISGLKEYNKHYFITSVLFSIGNRNIRCTKQKFFIGKPHVLCISSHTQCIKLKSYIFSFPIFLLILLIFIHICFIIFLQFYFTLQLYWQLMEIFDLYVTKSHVMYVYICIRLGLHMSHKKITVANNIPILPLFFVCVLYR